MGKPAAPTGHGQIPGKDQAKGSRSLTRTAQHTEEAAKMAESHEDTQQEAMQTPSQLQSTGHRSENTGTEIDYAQIAQTVASLFKPMIQEAVDQTL